MGPTGKTRTRISKRFERMIEDLIITINNIQSTSHQARLIIDANESFNSPEKGISSLVEHTGMINPIANKHRTRNEPTTHKSGRKRMDFILCTNRLTPFIQLCDILPFVFITTSDHICIYIYIHRKRLSSISQRSTTSIYRQQRKTSKKKQSEMYH